MEKWIELPTDNFEQMIYNINHYDARYVEEGKIKFFDLEYGETKQITRCILINHNTFKCYYVEVTKKG